MVELRRSESDMSDGMEERGDEVVLGKSVVGVVDGGLAESSRSLVTAVLACWA